MDYLVAIGILLGITIVFIVFQWIKTFGKRAFIKNLRDCAFYFRWFIIGKYHCPVDEKTKSFYRMLNKVFWGMILISFTITIAHIIELTYTI